MYCCRVGANWLDEVTVTIRGRSGKMAVIGGPAGPRSACVGQSIS